MGTSTKTVAKTSLSERYLEAINKPFFCWGEGDGTFIQRGMLPKFYGSLQSLLVDVNNDKHLHLLSAANGSLYVYLGDGKGNFTLMPFLNPGSGDAHFAITAADFNRDGNIDIVASNYNAQNIALYAGNGMARFKAPWRSTLFKER